MPLPDLSRIPRKTFLMVGVLLVLGIGTWLFFAFALPSQTEPIVLSFWGTDRADVWSTALTAYKENWRSKGYQVEVQYEEVPRESYREQVKNALAAGTGPDVFLISNRGLHEEQERLVPVPATQFSLTNLREFFPTVVEQDFVRGTGEVYALPLFVDTLALFYNRDLFDTAGIVAPAKNWDDFRAHAMRLRKLTNGQFEREGAAIGGSTASISHPTHLLELLMLQNGAPMIDTNNTARLMGSRNEGLEAFEFYVQFARPNSTAYVWSDDDRDLDAFAAERVAMMFGYATDAVQVKNKSPFLRFGVASMPQPLGVPTTISMASYEGLVVARQSKQPSWAWDFVIFATTDQNTAGTYVSKIGRPSALRTLIVEQAKDADTGIFASQILTARSWPVPHEKSVENLFDAAIRGVLSGNLETFRALRGAEESLGQLIR